MRKTGLIRSGYKDRYTGEPLACSNDMELFRERNADRRRITRGGRRASDPIGDTIGGGARLSATALWRLPDATRCWILRHGKMSVVSISRDGVTLDIEMFNGEDDARAQVDAWLVSPAASWRRASVAIPPNSWRRVLRVLPKPKT